jgi:predicted RNA-binding protein
MPEVRGCDDARINSEALEFLELEKRSHLNRKWTLKNVARIEAEGKGLWLINLFGEKTFIEGKIQTVNLTDGSFITLKKEENGMLLSV